MHITVWVGERVRQIQSAIAQRHGCGGSMVTKSGVVSIIDAID